MQRIAYQHLTNARTRIMVLASALLTLGVFAVNATPASASFTWCTGTGKVCFAADTSGNGANFTDNGPVGACQPMPSGWNDRISSVANKFTSSGGSITLWWDGGCNGSHQTYGPNTTVNDVGWWNNDEWSSYCIGTFVHTDPDSPIGCHQYMHD